MGNFQIEPQPAIQEKGDNMGQNHSPTLQRGGGHSVRYADGKEAESHTTKHISREAVSERSKGRAVGILQGISKREDLLSITFSKAHIIS